MWLFLYNIHIEWHSFREARDWSSARHGWNETDKAVKISVKVLAQPKPYLLMTALHVAVALTPSGTRKWGPDRKIQVSKFSTLLTLVKDINSRDANPRQ